MQSDNLLNINLVHAAETAEHIHVELTDQYFANLEQDEISGGDVHVDVFVTISAGGIFNVAIEMSGQVVVPCDRCLDPLYLDLKLKDTLKVLDAESKGNDSNDLKYLEEGREYYDFSWDFYEIIETSLPLQRTHPLGECNPNMVSYIITDDMEDLENL